MKLKNTPTRYKKERVVLSDLLPFEIPITFSNRHFYDFLIKHKVEISDDRLRWIGTQAALGAIIKLLFNCRDEVILNNQINIRKRDGNRPLLTIPFKYHIAHNENDFRELTLIHPINQLDIISFYDKYSQVILYFSDLGSFSIRRPFKVAKAFYFNDSIHEENVVQVDDYDSVEEYGKEYQNLKTFFVYKNYSNIHKFYESYKFHRSEKKYSNLFKFDISKCFDSIYTHSVAWAILGKDIIKENLPKSKKTFGGKLDTIMQNLNYGETNGIVIGPEFSRIFAELILQRIDHNVETNLLTKEKLLNKTHYEVFRYVDDYFVFYNEENDKEKILKEFRLQLKEFKLYLNDKKTTLYTKPIITEITISKQRILDLFSKYLTPDAIFGKESDEESEEGLNDSVNLYTNSNKLISKFKAIIKETNTEYKDIINYTLALIERKVKRIILAGKWRKKEPVKISRAILEILDFTFFIYSVSPRVNTTIKLCRILKSVTEYCSDLKRNFKDQILKKINDNIFVVLQKNRYQEHIPVETLYLLIALHELGSDYWLSLESLRQYIGIDGKSDPKNIKLNHLSIIVLLFYIKRKKRYNEIYEFLKGYIKNRFNSSRRNIQGKNAELVFLLFDILTCPYFDNDYKKELLALNGISDPPLQEGIIAFRKQWFTKWTNFDFGKELDTKHSKEVY